MLCECERPVCVVRSIARLHKPGSHAVKRERERLRERERERGKPGSGKQRVDGAKAPSVRQCKPGAGKTEWEVRRHRMASAVVGKCGSGREWMSTPLFIEIALVGKSHTGRQVWVGGKFAPQVTRRSEKECLKTELAQCYIQWRRSARGSRTRTEWARRDAHAPLTLVYCVNFIYYQGTTIKRMVEKIWYQKENSKLWDTTLPGIVLLAKLFAPLLICLRVSTWNAMEQRALPTKQSCLIFNSLKTGFFQKSILELFFEPRFQKHFKHQHRPQFFCNAVICDIQRPHWQIFMVTARPHLV